MIKELLKLSKEELEQENRRLIKEQTKYHPIIMSMMKSSEAKK